jgi:hypothetical protein
MSARLFLSLWHWHEQQIPIRKIVHGSETFKILLRAKTRSFNTPKCIRSSEDIHPYCIAMFKHLEHYTVVFLNMCD